MSALLFGMVHPGSKMILSSGLRLEMFCFAYIGIRLIAQLPFVIKTKAYKISNKGQFKIIILLGFVGASLQLSEFSGIANGANVSTVTFLVYTHPFWSILISKIFYKEQLGRIEFLKLFLALIGIVLVIGIDNFSLDNLKTHWVSLVAGLLIASWIKVSNVARKTGFSSLKTNFYYDLMSFVCLTVFILLRSKSSEFTELSAFLLNSKNLVSITVYSLFIGLLPNLLFYKGSVIVDSLTAGYILLLEPIIASAMAYFIWGDYISLTFMTGALFILSANIPDGFFAKILKLAPVTFWFFVMSLFTARHASANNNDLKKIILLEIIPTDSSEYTVSSEKQQIDVAAEMALHVFLKTNKCNLRLERFLEIGDEERLMKKVKEIKLDKSEKIVVGLSRTNFARVAAKVAVGSDIKAISVGASASNLGPINSNFMTMVNPWQEQFKLIKKIIVDNNCSKAETTGIFNAANFLSSNFMNVYKNDELGSLFTNTTGEIFDQKKRCIFVGLNFSEAAVVLSTLQKIKWQGTIIGLGDWNIYSEELLKITDKLSKNISVHVPSSWIPTSGINSKKFAEEFERKSKMGASPIAAYVYDGILLAGEYLCNGINIFGKVTNTPPMLRTYKGKSESGNLLTDMHIRTIKGLK